MLFAMVNGTGRLHARTNAMVSNQPAIYGTILISM
jgi:hypothetical protein